MMTREGLYELHKSLCFDAALLMADKNADYATETDPFRNFRMFGELGILVRMSDKLARLRTFSERGTLAVSDESVRDTILDLINYAVLLYGYIEDTRLDEDQPKYILNPAFDDAETLRPLCIGDGENDDEVGF